MTTAPAPRTAPIDEARLDAVEEASVPSTIAVDIGRAAGMILVGRAVSGHLRYHRP